MLLYEMIKNLKVSPEKKWIKKLNKAIKDKYLYINVGDKGIYPYNLNYGIRLESKDASRMIEVIRDGNFFHFNDGVEKEMIFISTNPFYRDLDSSILYDSLKDLPAALEAKRLYLTSDVILNPERAFSWAKTSYRVSGALESIRKKVHEIKLRKIDVYFEEAWASTQKKYRWLPSYYSWGIL